MPRCLSCGKEIKGRTNVKGDVFLWKDASLILSDDLFLYKCSRCQDYVFTAGDSEVLDDRLKIDYLLQHELVNM